MNKENEEAHIECPRCNATMRESQVDYSGCDECREPTEHEEARRLAFKRDMDALIFKAKQGRLSLGEQNDLGMMLSIWLDEQSAALAKAEQPQPYETERELARELERLREALEELKDHVCVEVDRALSADTQRRKMKTERWEKPGVPLEIIALKLAEEAGEVFKEIIEAWKKAGPSRLAEVIDHEALSEECDHVITMATILKARLTVNG